MEDTHPDLLARGCPVRGLDQIAAWEGRHCIVPGGIDARLRGAYQDRSALLTPDHIRNS
jgi:hypothetical protein